MTRLRWRPRLWRNLTLLCVGTTLLTAVVSQAIVTLIATLVMVRSPDTLAEVERSMYGYAVQIQPYFADKTPDRAGMDRWLEDEVRRGSLLAPDLYPVNVGKTFGSILDEQGVVLAAHPETALVGHPLPLSVGMSRALDAARSGKARALWDGARIVAAVPLRRGEKIVGFGVLRTESFSWLDVFWRSFLQMLMGTLILTGIGSLIVGSVLGAASARWVVRRLEGVSVAASAWARGDLEATAPESPADEFGELAVRLNRTARELSRVMELRSEVAVLEERESVLRELHDTVKQQAFAASLVVGSARACAGAGDSAGVERSLVEAELLTRQIQTELAGILAGGRTPPQGGTLAERLARVASDWNRRSGISVEAALPVSAPTLSDFQSEQLVRIADEAVANAVKHARCQKIVVALVGEPHGWRLSVTDDGVGFDPNETTAGRGLRSMRSRAETLPAGTYSVESGSNGTQVDVRFSEERS